MSWHALFSVLYPYECNMHGQMKSLLLRALYTYGFINVRHFVTFTVILFDDVMPSRL
jgi:hypothetical protein